MIDAALVVATLWCDSKLYAADKWEEALLAQDFDLGAVRLILLSDTNSPRSESYLENFAKRNAQRFAEITVLRSHPMWPGSFLESPYRSGHIALLRQQVLERYLADGGDAPLTWWDADLAWDSGYLIAVWSVVSGDSGQLWAAPYAARGMTLPACFEQHGGILRHLGREEVYAIDTAIPVMGGGGMAAQRSLWEDFQARGGWRSYARDGISGAPIWTWYGEDAHVSQLLGMPFRLMDYSWACDAWHWSSDGTAVRLTSTGVQVTRETAPGAFEWFRTANEPNPVKQLVDGVTVAVAATDLLSRGIDSFLKSLASQYSTVPQSKLRVLICCEAGSRVAMPYLQDWASRSGETGVSLVDVWEATSDDLYQELLSRYYALPSDSGLFFWGLDMAWDPGVLAQATQISWPIVTALYPQDEPTLRPNVSMVDADGKEASFPPASLSQHATCGSSGMGGLYLSRSQAELFHREGGWSGRQKEEHSAYLAKVTRCPIWIGQGLFGVRTSFYGFTMRIQWDSERKRHYMLVDNQRGETRREY